MMVNSHHTQANREKIIAREQTGATHGLTLQERIDHLTKEIKTAEGWIAYYRKPGTTKRMSKASIEKLIRAHSNLAEVFSIKREKLQAQLYAAQLDKNMPTFGGAMELSKPVTEKAEAS
jgi:uncharacterized protein YllA (UPF0747 family)